MRLRGIKTLAGMMLAGVTLTGCAQSGSNFTRTTPTLTPKVATGPKVSAPNPVMSQPTTPVAAAPTNASGWSGNSPTNKANSGGPIPITPAGTVPAMTNLPVNSIGPSSTIGPPSPPPGGPSIPLSSANTQPVSPPPAIMPAAVSPDAIGKVAEAQKTVVQASQSIAVQPPPGIKLPSSLSVEEVAPSAPLPLPSMDLAPQKAEAPKSLSPAPVMLSTMTAPPPPKPAE